MGEVVAPVLPIRDVERAIRLTYAQAMIGAVFSASTGGMFLIGYALKLKANNEQIGLLSSIPMLCVVVQLISSALIERGVSRRKLTIFSALANVLCWALVILIPYIIPEAEKNSSALRLTSLIAVVTLITLFLQITGNARWSWVGDLIPATFRGTFFGRLTMYGGIIGTAFALIEGRFLDVINSQGIQAFSWLFAFGMVFGLVNVFLFIPQRDIPLPRHEVRNDYWQVVRRTFTNHSLMLVMLFSLLWSMQGIAAPFYATYLLRDVKISFFSMGWINSIVTLTMLIASPFWGRMVDRYGCRPIIIACTAVQIPLPLIWIWLTYPHAVFMVLPFIHVLVGLASAGIAVALSTLIYKVIPANGRAIHAAVYSVIVTLGAAPMPALGGHFPTWLNQLGINADLRSTFFAQIFVIAAAWVAARYIREPDSRRTHELLRNLPVHLKEGNNPVE